MKKAGGLRQYRQKRNFKLTPEPAGKRGHKKGDTFVIHKHAARRLHYDLRLEMDGVLKSWAVPKGPSLDPTVKRLAIEVEDHPLDYGSFEGEIPKGEYGAGQVIIWDRGHWKSEQDGRKSWKKGDLHFYLDGKKLHGWWRLIRTRRAGSENSEKKQWLLIKSKDDAARPESQGIVTDDLPDSVASGRRMEDLKKKTSRAAAPFKFIEPQLATLASDPPYGGNWISEMKFDGYRSMARIYNDQVQIFSRNGLDWTHRYSAIATELKKFPAANAYLDGEIVVLDERGVSQFQLLQQALKDKNDSNMAYYVFDLLFYDGKDLRGTPLTERKALLEKLLQQMNSRFIRYSQHVGGREKELFELACSQKLEGIVSKQAYGSYISGRTLDWLKIKCEHGSEFIIVGFTAPGGSRAFFGSLLLGEMDQNQLHYVGRVGTGFDRKLLADIYRQLNKRKLSQPPKNLQLTAQVRRERNIQWVRPELVAQVDFRGWTQDHLLRQASFQGLREDKPAEQVTAEVKANIKPIRLTKPEKVLFPKPGITKQDLADYYEKVREWIWPWLENRPVALVRCPDGVTAECFFQKHVKDASWMKRALREVQIGSQRAQVLNAPESLRALVQMAVLEIHGWGCRMDFNQAPFEMVFDLDPAPDLDWGKVVQGAFLIREQLSDLGLTSFAKLSGGKGVHIHVPVERRYSFAQIKNFSQAVARLMVKTHPTLFTAQLQKKKRVNKMFIDYLRNGEGSTCIVPYSVRAREHASVATPIDWNELSTQITPDHFTVSSIDQRLAQLKKDPWRDYFNHQHVLDILEQPAKELDLSP